VKLAAAIGAWLGPREVVLATAAGLVLGGLLALAVILRAGAGLRSEVRTNLRTALFQAQLPAVPRRRPSERVPLAVALGAAAVAVLLLSGGLHA
jgi:Flp pilus assembly protein protease CpaA